jgi:hypothetical protein
MLLIHKQLSTNKAHRSQRSRSAQAAATEDTVFAPTPAGRRGAPLPLHGKKKVKPLFGLVLECALVLLIVTPPQIPPPLPNSPRLTTCAVVWSSCT